MYIQLRDRIEIEHNNKQLSFGQANNIAMNSENEKERLEVFELLTSTLHKEKEIFATVLNQIGRLRNAKSNEIEDRDFNTIFSCEWHFRSCIIPNVECDRRKP